MAEAPRARLWIGRATWAALMLGMVFLRLLPLDTLPRNWAPPDLMLAITLVWAARRPDFLPVWLVGLVFFGADLLFQRPPGLWAALVVLLTEWLRRRAAGFRSLPFLLEWMTVAIGVAGITIAYRSVLFATMTPQAPLHLTVVQAALTVLCYPAVVGLAHLVFGVSRPAPGAVDSLGHRI